MSENLQKITANEYEKICQEVCASFMPSGDREKDEAILLHSICSRVHEFLNDRNWRSVRIVGGSLKDISESNLLAFVAARQSEPFMPLEVAYMYIHKLTQSD